MQVNRMLIELSGAVAVPVYYDSTDEELYDLLGKINGVHFTGGGLTLVDRVTGVQHPYYVTSKKIFQYSIQQKDLHNISFPLTGIC